MNKCLQCGKETINPKFCSRNCSATYTNSKFPKRIKTPHYCKICGKEIQKSGTYYKKICITCKTDRKSYSDAIKNTTISEYKDKLKRRNVHPSWLYGEIRGFARSWNKNLPKKCMHCGYDKHVELCHIIPLSKFPDNTLLKEANSEDNIFILCPNCHWEFDNGLLTKESILSC
jgi:5-methylcytosine-specific restriction endonuclease McrA